MFSRMMVRLVVAGATWAAVSSMAWGADRLDATASGKLTQLASTSVGTTESLLRDELKSVLLRMADAGAFSGKPEDVALSLSMPAERVVDLGLVVDSRDAATAGLVVLGTTPGGLAQSLGVRAGDVLIAFNGQSLAGLGVDEQGTARAISTLRAGVDGLRDLQPITFDARRGGDAVQLQGALHARYLPALRLELGEGTLVASNAPVALGSAVSRAAPAASGDTCGRVSTFHVAPRSKHLYGTRLLEIDGQLAGPATQNTFRLDPGQHELLIAEDIDARDLPTTLTRRRTEWGRKTLTITVEPGMTYLLAAQLDDPRAPNKDYWQPVAWKTVAEPCH